MPSRYLDDAIAEIVHEKTVEVLLDVGFCVPEPDTLVALRGAGFHVDWESQMVRLTPELLDVALDRLPRGVQLFDRTGKIPAFSKNRSCFMGSGTPVNVLDLETGEETGTGLHLFSPIGLLDDTWWHRGYWVFHD